MKLMMILSLALGASAFAHDHDKMAKPEMPKEFSRLEALKGTWEGTTQRDGKEMPVTVQYETTAGGSVVMAKMFPGTDHEMVNMFARDGKKMEMTHYCAGGNHPRMTMKKADDKSMSFEVVGSAGLDSPKEMHMHALTITWIDADHIREDWTNYKDGKKSETAQFTYARKKN